MIPLIFVAGVALAAQFQPSVAPEQPHAESVRLGDCRATSGPVDLRRLMVLANSSVLVGDRHIGVRDENVRINTSHGETVIDVAHLVNPNTDLDIELRLALLGNDLAIYWRETFRHRTYRQGVLRVDGESVTPVCVGTGGVDQSH